ncbi:MAG: hypothetical protein GY913_34670 [Proteobacteria bacterium]|nr:hypothetical protein [Pseudomonadota bacterium]MCP4922075.1 hypothetical protein [Pseudomonadota bacterium]
MWFIRLVSFLLVGVVMGVSIVRRGRARWLALEVERTEDHIELRGNQLPSRIRLAHVDRVVRMDSGEVVVYGRSGAWIRLPADLEGLDQVVQGLE